MRCKKYPQPKPIVKRSEQLSREQAKIKNLWQTLNEVRLLMDEGSGTIFEASFLGEIRLCLAENKPI